jgi:hypothetical protein
MSTAFLFAARETIWSTTVDLNQLYHRHQVSLYMSDNAPSAHSRATNLALANGYAAEIFAAKRLARASLPDGPGHVIAFRNVEIVA